MPALPTLSGRDVVRVFGKDGWVAVRQRGSHIMPVKAEHIANRTLRRLIRLRGLSV